MLKLKFIKRIWVRLRDAVAEYGPRKTLHNRKSRWIDTYTFGPVMVGLAVQNCEEKTVLIAATKLKSHQTASRMGVKQRLGRLIMRTTSGITTKVKAICTSLGALTLLSRNRATA